METCDFTKPWVGSSYFLNFNVVRTNMLHDKLNLRNAYPSYLNNGTKSNPNLVVD